MKLLRIILLPFVPIYALAIVIRNYLFDKGIFKEKKVGAKVVSVGNITVGGSGKTPTVIYIISVLKNYKKKVGVLSRGYGRKSKGYILVSKAEKPIVSVQDCGDEIYQTISECSIPGAVSEKRAEGAMKLIKDTGVDTIVLDDAFQHRWIHRDMNLVVCEQRFLFDENIFNQGLLPSGNMRERFSALKRADAIIINRKFSDKQEIPSDLIKYFKNKRIFTAKYKAIHFVDVIKGTSYRIDEFNGQKSLVVSGVANPFSLINILNQLNVNTTNKLIFRDHKNYTLKEVQQIRKSFYSTNSHSVVTTQKDAVKLSRFQKEMDDIDIFYLKIEVEFDDCEGFESFLINNLNGDGDAH